MPCLGPNLDYARQQAGEAAEKVIQMLARDYQIVNPGQYRFIQNKDYPGQLRELLENIFVDDACDNF